ncbi:MAG: hypothetical protein ABIJ47_03865 [Candidatus Bathyarchaeota archaeon]
MCRALKEQPRTRHIPVVMFTALGRDVDRRMAAEAGADGYVTKPFTAELAGYLRRHLEASRRTGFSGALGLSHMELRGRKILMEYSPSTPYERCVRDFLEARAYGEGVAVLSPSTSALHRALLGDEAVELVPVTPQTILSPILDAHRDEPLALVYDNLTDHALSAGFEAAYGFAQETLRRLDEPRFTAIFLLNPEAHESREVHGFRGLFGDQVSYGEQGLEKIRLL